MNKEREVELTIGVVLRRFPGVTKWKRWNWLPIAVIPGSSHPNWKILRQDKHQTDFHAGTCSLHLHRSEVEAYKVSLSMAPPSVFVVLEKDDSAALDFEFQVHLVTASAYLAQDYSDCDEYLVEAVPMPEGLLAWVSGFVDTHYEERPFVKRQRDKIDLNKTQDGIGDMRIKQTADVYRNPLSLKKRVEH